MFTSKADQAEGLRRLVAERLQIERARSGVAPTPEAEPSPADPRAHIRAVPDPARTVPDPARGLPDARSLRTVLEDTTPAGLPTRAPLPVHTVPRRRSGPPPILALVAGTDSAGCREWAELQYRGLVAAGRRVVLVDLLPHDDHDEAFGMDDATPLPTAAPVASARARLRAQLLTLAGSSAAPPDLLILLASGSDLRGALGQSVASAMLVLRPGELHLPQAYQAVKAMSAGGSTRRFGLCYLPPGPEIGSPAESWAAYRRLEECARQFVDARLEFLPDSPPHAPEPKVLAASLLERFSCPVSLSAAR